MRGLRQFVVRGLAKVQAAMQWQVLVFNFTRLQSLGWLARLGPGEGRLAKGPDRTRKRLTEAAVSEATDLRDSGDVPTPRLRPEGPLRYGWRERITGSEGAPDWFHVSEHVWEAARTVAPDAPEVWSYVALDQGHDGGGTALQTWLESQGRGLRGARRTAADELPGYVRSKTHLMDYPRCRVQGWAIGTGMREATCK